MSVTVAFVFPGQGSQRIGMLHDLSLVDGGDRLLDAAEALSGLRLREIAEAGTPAQLADTRAAQPLLYLADWAAAQRALAVGVRPAALAGHSLGELAALAIAGVYSAEAGLELVVERSALMAAVAADTPGSMAAVLGLDPAAIGSVVTGIPGVWVANDNAPGQVVISGTETGVSEASVALIANGARRVVPLAVAGPFHSPLMEPAAHAFARVLEGAEFSDARIAVYQNTTATSSTDAVEIRRRLAAQITSPVRWTETMHDLVAGGIGTLLECGPGAVLTGLAKRVEGLTAHALEQTDLGSFRAEVDG